MSTSCKTCGRGFTRPYNLQRHIQTVHDKGSFRNHTSQKTVSNSDSSQKDTDSDTTDTEVSGSGDDSNGDDSEDSLSANMETDVTESEGIESDDSDDSDEDDDDASTDGDDLWQCILHISQDLNAVLRRSLKRKRIDLKQKEMLLKQMRYPTIDEDDDNDTDDVS